jgi:hypothetical protein
MHVDVCNRHGENKHDGKVINHVNCCRVDDRSRNLVLTTRSQNSRNQKNVKGYVRVGRKWRIQILINRAPRFVPMNSEVEAKVGREYLTKHIETVERIVVSDDMSNADLAKWLEQKLRNGKLLEGAVIDKGPMSSPVKPTIVSPVVKLLAAKKRRNSTAKPKIIAPMVTLYAAKKHRLNDEKMPVKFADPVMISVVAAKPMIGLNPVLQRW